MTPPLRLYLADCNSFYCEAERVFNPRLNGKPLVVLSNNDGSIVSRTAEAKARGLKMSEPWHLVKNTERGRGVIALSSNYELYADMSNRFNRVLTNMTPHVERYSIDESFGLLSGVRDQLEFGHRVRDTVAQHVGLPICVGLSNTRTRAKLANKIAKKHPEHRGVFDLDALDARASRKLLSSIDAADVWGIGGRLAPRLAAAGFHTVQDLVDADPHHIRRLFGVVLQRTVQELQGTSTMPFGLVPPPQKQIMCSRSFGQPIERISELREAAVSYVSRAAEKLRRQQLVAGAVVVFAHTNPFKPEEPQYSGSLTIPLPVPTDDTLQLAKVVAFAMRRIYRPGFAYKKAGTMLTELQPRNTAPTDLFAAVDDGRRARLNATLDAINGKFGRGTLAVAGAGIQPRWSMKRGSLTPAYTTSWEDLPLANGSMSPQR